MKKALLLAVLVFVYLSSCKKDNKSPSGTKYKVQFNVSGFSQQIVGVASKNKQPTGFNADPAAPLTYAIDQLHYYAYNSSSDSLVSVVDQDSTFANFGTIDDYLLPGTYFIVIAGSKAGDTYSSGPVYKDASIGATPGNWADTFSQVFSLTVGTQPINQNVTLKRIVGKLSVLITDKLPATASTLSISFNDASNYQLSTGTLSVQPRTSTFSIPPSAIGTANYKKSLLMLNTVSPFTVLISCADATGKVLAQSTVSNVTIQQNTETVLSGALFGSNVGFGLTLNQVWDSTPITIKY